MPQILRQNSAQWYCMSQAAAKDKGNQRPTMSAYHRTLSTSLRGGTDPRVEPLNGVAGLPTPSKNSLPSVVAFGLNANAAKQGCQVGERAD